MISALALALILMITATPVLISSAQSQDQLHIHKLATPQEVSTQGGAVGLTMQVSFSFLDQNDQLLTSPEIVDASLTVVENQFEAEVAELETSWSIVVLVDTSQNLARSQASSDFNTARNVLASTIGGFPDGANVSLMQFDQSPRVVVPFEQGKERAQNSVRTLRATPTGNSCLNEALYTAVGNLAPAPGRRAVILFTASSDNCVSRQVDEVVDLALANQVEIYAVGLSGYAVSANDLAAFSGPTGGVSYLRDSGTLTFGLSNISGILINQWRARATVFPPAGEQSLVLTVNLADGTSLVSNPITFTSAQDYIPPTQINIPGTVQSTPNGIVFNMDYVQPQKIRQLNVSIVNNDTGQSIMSQSLLSFSDVIVLTAPSLFPGLEYTLMVTAVDEAGQVLSEDQAEFEYEPPQSQVIISAIDPPNFERSSFLLDVGARNVSDAVKFRAWLAPEQEAQQPIEGTQVTVPLGDPVLIPADGLPSGQYVAIAQALDAGDTVLAQSAPTPFTFTRPGMLERLSAWVQGSPMATIAITGVCCLSVLGLGALAWVVIPRRDDREVEIDLVMPDKGRGVRAPQPPRPPRKEPRAPEPPRRASPPSPPVKPPVHEEPRKAPVAPPRKAATPAEGPAARLKLLYPEQPPFSIEMRETPFRVGRRADNEAALPLDSSTGVSGFHMTVFYKDGKYFLRDDNSSFGTTINGQEIPKRDPAELHDGDRIGLGPMVKLSFEIISGGSS